MADLDFIEEIQTTVIDEIFKESSIMTPEEKNLIMDYFDEVLKNKSNENSYYYSICEISSKLFITQAKIVFVANCLDLLEKNRFDLLEIIFRTHPELIYSMGVSFFEPYLISFF
jgi:hypothetical protein